MLWDAGHHENHGKRDTIFGYMILFHAVVETVCLLNHTSP